MSTDVGTDLDTARRLAVAVGRINRRIRPRRDGVSHGVVSALAAIDQSGPIRPTDLAKLESVAAPTMTRLLADLESRGLISRTPDPTDGRSFFVTATDAGVEMVTRARFERAERIAALLDELDPAQLKAVEGALDALEAIARTSLPQV